MKEQSELLESILMMVFELFADARTMVPDSGNDFKPVYKRLNIEGYGYKLTDIILAVNPIPKGIADYDVKRALEIKAYNLPFPMKVTRMLKSGNKSEILEYLKDKDLPAKILSILPQLDDNLNN